MIAGLLTILLGASLIVTAAIRAENSSNEEGLVSAIHRSSERSPENKASQIQDERSRILSQLNSNIPGDGIETLSVLAKLAKASNLTVSSESETLTGTAVEFTGKVLYIKLSTGEYVGLLMPHRWVDKESDDVYGLYELPFNGYFNKGDLLEVDALKITVSKVDGEASAVVYIAKAIKNLDKGLEIETLVPVTLSMD